MEINLYNTGRQQASSQLILNVKLSDYYNEKLKHG